MGHKSYSLSSELTKPVVVLTFLGILLFLAVLFFFCFFGSNPPPEGWEFVARPPMPLYARHIHTSYSTVGGSRKITFETNQPVERIRQFYQTRLPKHGWRIVCQTTAPSDVQDRLPLDSGDQALKLYELVAIIPGELINLHLSIKAEGHKRFVSVAEVKHALYCSPNLFTPTPIPGNSQRDINPTPDVYPGPETTRQSPTLAGDLSLFLSGIRFPQN